jgi:hypothetical protein
LPSVYDDNGWCVEHGLGFELGRRAAGAKARSVLRDLAHPEPGDAAQIRPDEMAGENVRIGGAQAQSLKDPLRELMKGFGFVQVFRFFRLSHGADLNAVNVIHTRLYEPRNSRRCRSISRVGSPAAPARLPRRIP